MNEDRQADGDTVHIAAGREDYGSQTGRTVRGFKKNDKPRH